MTKCRLACFMLAGALGAIPGCGRTSSGGETGSETHWLASCQTNADCGVGECLCGVCSERCEQALDCPAPLDVCSAPNPVSGCAVAVCGSSAPVPGQRTAALEAEQRIDACDAGRPTAFVTVPDRREAERAFANGERGFLLGGLTSAYEGPLNVNLAGHPTGTKPSPSLLNPALEQSVPLPDGSLLLTGVVADFDGGHGWVGKVDAAWNLVWEVVLQQPLARRANIVGLPNGGSVVSTLEQSSLDAKAFDVTWTRLSPQGDVAWQRRASFDGSVELGWASRRTLAVTDSSELRIAVNTSAGLQIIAGTLEGESAVGSPALTLSDVTHVAALSEDRLAVMGQTKIAVLSADGEVVWQQDYAAPSTPVDGDGSSYPTGNFAYAMAFDARRQELVLAGQTAEQGSWLYAVDLTGKPTWEVRRQPQPADASAERLRAIRGYGPPLVGLAIADDGTLLAPALSNERLGYFVVGSGSCGG